MVKKEKESHDSELEFGSLLQQYRIKQGLTQKELADNIGATASSISRWEQGSRYPPEPAILKSIASILHLDKLEKLRLIESAGFLVIDGYHDNPVLSPVIAILEDDVLSEKEKQIAGNFIYKFAGRFVSAIKAKQLLENGNISEAEKLCHELFKDQFDLGYYLRCSLCVTLARIKYLQGDLPESIRLYNLAGKDVQRINDREIYYSIIMGTGDVLRSQGNWDDALEQYNDALKIASSANDTFTEAQLQRKIAVVLLLRNKWPDALRFCENCLKSAEVSGDNIFLAKSLSTIAWTFLQKGDWEAAITNYQEAISLLEKEQNIVELCTCMTYFAEAIHRAGRTDEAIKVCEEVLRLSEDIEMEKERGKVLSMAASFINLIGGAEESLGLFETALSLLEQSGNKHAIAGNYLEMGKAYCNMLDPINAANCYELAKNLFNQVEDTYGLVSCLYQLGELEFTEAKFESAKQFIEQGIKAAKESDYHYLLAGLFFLSGKLAISESNIQQGTQLFVQACIEGNYHSPFSLEDTFNMLLDQIQAMEDLGKKTEAVILTSEILKTWEKSDSLVKASPQLLVTLRSKLAEYERVLSLMPSSRKNPGS
ncbi:MAG: tetratricopeptide repeat protein [bacterium]|nr:tetratricopeptide repeat protein [bacterium]